jgi:hypothetical protein
VAPGRPPSVLGRVPPTRRGHRPGATPSLGGRCRQEIAPRERHAAGPREPPACGFGGTAQLASEFVNTSSERCHRLRNHQLLFRFSDTRPAQYSGSWCCTCQQPATVLVSLGNHLDQL